MKPSWDAIRTAILVITIGACTLIIWMKLDRIEQQEISAIEYNTRGR